jgi:hypothetical protein
MQERKNYIVADLVKELDVPRTTVNDWLSRYDQYIEFEPRGRRKVYFDSSLQVLKDILEMRNQGKSSYEIEEELTKKHPLHAEVASDKEERSKKSGKVSVELEDPAENSNGGELMAPAEQGHMNEVARMLGKDLLALSVRLEESQKINKDFSRKNRRWLILTMGLIVALGASAIIISSQIVKMIKSQQGEFASTQKVLAAAIIQTKDTLKDELKKREAQIEEQKKELKNLSVLLDKNSSDYITNINKLRTQMGSQEKAFYKMLDKYSADLSTKHKAELALMKDNFSKERLTLLKKLEQLSTELAAKQKSMQDLNKKLEAIEKLTIPVSKAKTVKETKPVVDTK